MGQIFFLITHCHRLQSLQLWNPDPPDEVLFTKSGTRHDRQLPPRWGVRIPTGVRDAKFANHDRCDDATALAASPHAT